MNIEKQFSEIYLSNKRKDEKLYFKVDYQLSLHQDFEKNNFFSINVVISYLILIKNDKCFETLKQTNSWKLTSMGSYKQTSFRSSIMIYPKYRSYGIGSFLLNKILSIANEYIPNYSLEDSLSRVDEYKENRERRDRLYISMGFEIKNRKIYIDKLSKLNFDRNFDYIELLDTKNIAGIFCQLKNENENLKTINQQLISKNSFYQKENEKLPRTCFFQSFLLLLFIIFISYWFLS